MEKITLAELEFLIETVNENRNNSNTLASVLKQKWKPEHEMEVKKMDKLLPKLESMKTELMKRNEATKAEIKDNFGEIHYLSENIQSILQDIKATIAEEAPDIADRIQKVQGMVENIDGLAFEEKQNKVAVEYYKIDIFSENRNEVVKSNYYSDKGEYVSDLAGLEMAGEFVEGQMISENEYLEGIEKEALITEHSTGIVIDGHFDTWYTIDKTEVNGKSYFLMENEKYGDEAAAVIIDESGKPVMDDVYNGFEDLQEFLENEQFEISYEEVMEAIGERIQTNLAYIASSPNKNWTEKQPETSCITNKLEQAGKKANERNTKASPTLAGDKATEL